MTENKCLEEAQSLKNQKIDSSLNVIDFWKCNFDFLKHLTSLSTGSILMIAIFLEKIFVNPIYKNAIIVSICSFLITVFFATLAYGVSVTSMPKPLKQPTDTELTIVAVAVAIAWLSFFIAVLSFVIFILGNFLL